MSTPNTTALDNYAGKYEKKIFATMRNGMDIARDVTVVPGVKNKETRTKLVVASGARPYREQFDADDNDLSYLPRVLETNLNKRDVLINPLKYRTGYLSEVMAKGVNPNEIPYEAFVWQEYLRSIAEEINNVAAYFGTGYNPAGSAAVDMAEGYASIIAAEVLAGNITVETTGAITQADAYDQFIAVHRALPVPYKMRKHRIYSSVTNFENLMDSFEDKVGKYTITDVSTGDVVGLYLPKTMKKCIVTPATWMGNSDRLIATPKENMEMGVDSVDDPNKIYRDTELEIIKARVLFAIGFQIRDLDAIVVSDQV